MQKKWQSWFVRLPHLVRYILVFGVVLFISFLAPKNAQFKYHFEKGQIWRYDDLIAPFDFAVQKSQEELAADVQNIETGFSPYYLMVSGVAKDKKRRFTEEFAAQLNMTRNDRTFRDVLQIPNVYADYGSQMLDRIYQRGIIQLAPEHKDKGKEFVINIVRGNTTQQQTVENILTPQTAKELLTDSLPYSRLKEPEFLYPLLENALAPNLIYSDTLTAKFREALIAQLPTHRGMVREGEVIVGESTAVSEETYQKLISFQAQYEAAVSGASAYWWILVGYFLMAALVIGLFAAYLRLYAPEVHAQTNKLVFVMIWPAVYSYLLFATEQTAFLSAYLLPFCVVPIVVKTFFTARLALFTHLIVVVITGFLSSIGLEFVLLQLLAGMVVLVSKVDTRDWSRFFYSMLYIYLTYIIAYLAISLVQEGNFQTLNWPVFGWLGVNVFLTLLAYPLIPLLERIFGFTSPITLVELSDMNRPLLRELALKAPGTLQHSLQVGNLSEAAARRIGADHLLIRVAALYHDIGKTHYPEYFVENQTVKNPHADLSNKESAQIIIGHVSEGVKMAKKYRLPKVLVDFIKTHHGTTRAEYFFRNYIKENPDFEEGEDQSFRYPGPKPHTKEEAILMLADSIEAAGKSLKHPKEKELEDLVDKIIAGKVTQHQLSDSDLTFSELESCRQVFKEVLKSIYHGRIEYPEPEAEQEASE
ncbi:MAG: HDIG domain-containing protein [Saprospiraceae bacterium]|nr:HDIG domain-containing protein [Saprospiraceae bacterium]